MIKQAEILSTLQCSALRTSKHSFHLAGVAVKQTLEFHTRLPVVQFFKNLEPGGKYLS
jgi:hypothetical protein